MLTVRKTTGPCIHSCRKSPLSLYSRVVVSSIACYLWIRHLRRCDLVKEYVASFREGHSYGNCFLSFSTPLFIAWPFKVTLAEYQSERHYPQGERWPVRGSHLSYLDRDISFARIYMHHYFPSLGKVMFLQNDGRSCGILRLRSFVVLTFSLVAQ